MARTDATTSEAGTAKAAAAGRFRQMARRSRYNLAGTVAHVRTRHAARRPPSSHLPWRTLLSVVLLSILLAALLLDGIADRYRAEWPDWLRTAAGLMTDIGLSGWYIVPAVVILLVMNLADWRKAPMRRRMAWANWTGLAFYVLLSVAGSGLIVTTLKRLIGRARPHVEEGIAAFDPISFSAAYASFPSGHSTTVGAMTAVLFLLLPKARLIVLPLGIWLASTRIFVGAHFPSDVLAGFVFGFGFAVAAALLFARLGFVFRKGPGLFPVRRDSFRLFPRKGSAQRRVKPRDNAP